MSHYYWVFLTYYLKHTSSFVWIKQVLYIEKYMNIYFSCTYINVHKINEYMRETMKLMRKARNRNRIMCEFQ